MHLLARFALPLLLAAQLATAPAAHAGGPITSGTVVTGALASPSFSETWTCFGTSGQRIVIAAIAAAAPLNTHIRLLRPNATVAIDSPNDRTEFQLDATGTWTIVIEDVGLDDTGGYSLGFINLQGGPLTSAGDLDGGAIASNEIRTAAHQVAPDFDVFTFSATNGDRIAFTAVSSTGAPHNTQVWLYPPGGGSTITITPSDRFDVQVNATGTWYCLVEDQLNDHTGTYTVSYVNLTAGPLTSAGDPDGGPITSAQNFGGTMSGTGDLDAWTFTGTAGQHIVLNARTTSGTLNTALAVYGPAGAPALVTTSNDRVDIQIAVTGTHTLVIEDIVNVAAGAYALTFVNLQGGPLTSAGDPDGGAIASNEIRTATHQVAPDFDVFAFSATNGDRIAFTAISSTGAPHNTQTWLYPPGGGSAISVSVGDRFDVQVSATGTWYWLVEDQLNDHTGSYILSYVNLTAGPLTSAGDPDGGPITSAQHYSGTMSGTGDLDAWTFTGTAGQRIVLAARTTSGTLNTAIAVYGPAGAPAVVNSSNDRTEVQLNATGTHIVVIEDIVNVAVGAYALTFVNLQGGPLTSAGDPDGGAIASNEIRTATHQVAPDFDVFAFNGVLGQRVLLTAVSSSGAPHNTQMWLYPPGGGSAITVAAGDQVDALLNASGTWYCLVEDQLNDHTGTYTVSLVNVSVGPYVSGAETEGGLIASGQTRNGQMSSLADLDVYTFTASTGDTARIQCVATLGSWNTNTGVYRLATGALLLSTSNDINSVVIPGSGDYAIVVQDALTFSTGNYQLTLSGALRTVDTPGANPMPASLSFAPTAPNPSRGAVRLDFALPELRHVRLDLYDVRGARVRTLTGGDLPAGTHRLTWDGRGADGRPAPAGMYFAELRAGRESVRRTLVRIE